MPRPPDDRAAPLPLERAYPIKRWRDLFHGVLGLEKDPLTTLQWRLFMGRKTAMDPARATFRTDGELLLVRGGAQAFRDSLPSLLGEGRGVWRRVLLRLGRATWVVEQAVDFLVVDPSEQPLLASVHGALWAVGAPQSAPDPKLGPLDEKQALRLAQLPWPVEARQELDAFLARARAGSSGTPPRAGEQLLRAGATVELLGYKARFDDPSWALRHVQPTPVRTQLRTGKDQPLVIVTKTA